MEKSTKILIGLTTLAVVVTAIVILKKKSEEKKSNIHGHPSGRIPRFGRRDIYGASYVFPYTPLYGYDQCTYKDKNGLLIAAPCRDGWSRAW